MTKNNFLIKIITLLLITSVSLFAVDEIITWGYGRQLHDILRAIQSMTGNSNDAFVKIVTIIGLFVVVFRITSSGNADYMSIAKFLVMATFVVNMFWTQQREFVIRDKVNNFVSPAVLSIPPGIGYTFSFFSRLEEGVGEKFEAAFSTPNSISYQKAGLGFMMSAHLGMDTATIIKPELTQTFNAYLDNCLLNSALMNNQDLSYLLKSKDLYNDLAINEAWLTPVYTSSGNPVMKQCLDAWSDIQIMLSGSQDQIISQFASSFGQISATDVTGKLGDVAKTLFNNTGTSAQAYINQMALLNMYNSGLQAVALSTGGSMSNIAVASAVRDASTQQSWLHTGLQAKKTLPLQKAFLTMISTVLLLLMALYSIALADFSGITQMFKLLITFSLWTPLAIVINYMTYTTIEAVTSGITANDLPSILTKVAISQETSGYLAFLGYAITLVTAMAFTLTTKSATGFVTAVASAGMSASVLRTAETVGGQGAINTNTVSAGNRSFDNHSQSANSVYGRAVDRAFVSGVNTVEGGGGTTSHANHLGTEVETRAGFYKAQFKNGEMTDASVDGFSTSMSTQGARSLNEAASITSQAMSQISMSRLNQIANTVRNSDEASAVESVQKTYGVDRGTAQTLVNGVKEAEAEAHKSVSGFATKGTKQSSMDGTTYTDASIGLGGGKGLLQGEIKGGVRGQQTTGSGISSEASNSESGEKQKSYEASLNTQFQQMLSEKNTFSHALGNTFTHTSAKDTSASSSQTAMENVSYQEARAMNQAASTAINSSATYSTDYSTALLKNIAAKSGLTTKEEQVSLLDALATDIKNNGGANFKNLMADAQKEQFFKIGVDTDRLSDMSAKLAGNSMVINAVKQETQEGFGNLGDKTQSALNKGVDNSAVKASSGGGEALKDGFNLPSLSGGDVKNANRGTEVATDTFMSDTNKDVNRAPFGPIQGAGGAMWQTMESGYNGWKDMGQIDNHPDYMRSVVNGGANNTNIPSGRGGFEDLLGKKGDKTVVVQESNPRAKVNTEAIRSARGDKERIKEK